MNPLKTALEPVHGESYKEQKQRFKKALEFVEPHMDRFYSGPTLRRFARTPSHVRNVKQVGIVDWEVLEYWAREYVPAEIMPQAWKAEQLVA